MTTISRRTFLSAAAATGAAFMLPAGFAAEPHRFGPNDTIRLGFIGLHGRGNELLGAFRKVPNVSVAALCDVDADVLAERMAQAQKLGEKPGSFGDPRKLFEDASIDAVVIATPNHTHSLLAIWAMQAGKHVYVEKPVSHNVFEGRQLVAAATKYGKIVQAGTQNRSDKGIMAAYADLHAGTYGAVRAVRGICYRTRKPIGKRETPLAPPRSVDYDLWLGPAADEPMYRDQFHYDWHWSWNTGNGDIGNQCPHELDMICWALKDPGMPKRTVAIGGRVAYNDAGQTPNLLACHFELGGVPIGFEMRNIEPTPRTEYRGLGFTGVVLFTEQGELRAQRGGASFVDAAGKLVKKYPGDSGATHQANFINALRAGHDGGLQAQVQKNHHAAAMAHLANASMRIGRPGTMAEASALAAPMPDLLEQVEHFDAILKDHGLDWSKPVLNLGAMLTMDDAGMVTGEHAAAANPILTGTYRKGFEVPTLA